MIAVTTPIRPIVTINCSRKRQAKALIKAVLGHSSARRSLTLCCQPLCYQRFSAPEPISWTGKYGDKSAYQMRICGSEATSLRKMNTADRVWLGADGC